MIPIQTHHLESLGWTLIHFCWQAAAIAITYKVADLTIARGTRRADSARPATSSLSPPCSSCSPQPPELSSTKSSASRTPQTQHTQPIQ